MNTTNHGVCRLCGSDAELQNSHVLPEFLYQHLYDDKHRSVGLKPAPGAKGDFLQKGLRERLLCARCETQLSKYETYSAEVLRNLPDTSSEKPGAVINVTGVDYKKFKIFEMSLLWRAGLAEQGSFAEVKLGPHEATLRKLLLDENPGSALEYPCLLVRLRGPGNLEGIITMPRCARFAGHKAYQMILWGMLWTFLVSGHSREISERASFLSEAGVLPLHVATETVKEFLAGMAQHMKKNGLL
jgi:hypothetical protein